MILDPVQDAAFAAGVTLAAHSDRSSLCAHILETDGAPVPSPYIPDFLAGTCNTQINKYLSSHSRSNKVSAQRTYKVSHTPRAKRYTLQAYLACGAFGQGKRKERVNLRRNGILFVLRVTPNLPGSDKEFRKRHKDLRHLRGNKEIASSF